MSIAEAREAIRNLQPGAGTIIKLPGTQPHNRMAYQRLNQAAYALWGAGTYQLKAGRGEVIVRRRLAAKLDG